MVSRHSLELNLNISFHRSTDRVESLASIRKNVDFVLDVLDSLFSTNPSWSSSQLRVIILLNIVVLALLDDVEVVSLIGCWLFSVDHFVKVIVNYLTEIDD
jgi:hypothetical protein